MKDTISLKREECGEESSLSDFVIVAEILQEYHGVTPRVIIPNGVQIIAEGCFRNLETMEYVHIPPSVRAIKAEAFMNCINLRKILISNEVVEIGDRAFKNCGLYEVALPLCLEKLGEDVFMQCNSLMRAKVSPTCSVEYHRTFKQCYSLKHVECSLDQFCLSFYSSTEADKKGDRRPTLFDCFQATPFLEDLHKLYREKKCIKCRGELDSEGVCKNCGAKHVKKAQEGCYVATCVYGSYDCPEVWTLRRYRDENLAKTPFGRAFIKCYYAVSPTLVSWFGRTRWFQAFWRKVLTPFVIRLNEKGYADTPYDDRKY